MMSLPDSLQSHFGEKTRVKMEVDEIGDVVVMLEVLFAIRRSLDVDIWGCCMLLPDWTFFFTIKSFDNIFSPYFKDK